MSEDSATGAERKRAEGGETVERERGKEADRERDASRECKQRIRLRSASSGRTFADPVSTVGR